MKRLKKSSFLLVFLLLLSSGCAQVINTYSIESIDSIPRVTYSTYLFSSGEGERLRAAFLKSPEADVEIIPYSTQIINTIGSFEDAMAFMRRESGYQSIEIQGVSYKGKTIGYLLTYSVHKFAKESMEIKLYEHSGKIYFSILEKLITY